MPYPLRKPAYRRFEVDDLGRIWLETWQLSQCDDGAGRCAARRQSPNTHTMPPWLV